MKKLLSILSVFSLTAAGGMSVIACAEHLTFVEYENARSIDKAWNISRNVIVGNVSIEANDEKKALEEIEEEIFNQTAIKFSNNNSSSKIVEIISKYKIVFYRTNREQSKILDGHFIGPMGLFDQNVKDGPLVNKESNFFVKFVGATDEDTTGFLQIFLVNRDKISVSDNQDSLSFPMGTFTEENPYPVGFTSNFFNSFNSSKPSDWNTSADNESLQLKRFKNGVTSEISNNLQKQYLIESFSKNGEAFNKNFDEFVSFLYTKENKEATEKLNIEMQTLLSNFQSKNVEEISKPIQIAGLWFSIFLDK
ncbi:lipoprotein [Spiroplasma endosymbiont of Panorpa germanica]|uniref:lipoprotein n=1 Tax=Spiroplasma endosymbiont of Panorpa germanica TaxID=3066314 RepID=UPI0030D33645